MPNADSTQSGTPCETADCKGRAERYVSGEGDGAYAYCRDCADLLMRHGETDNGPVDDPVVIERDRYRAAITTALRLLFEGDAESAEITLGHALTGEAKSV